MTRREQAIEIVKSSRQTHEEWAEFLRARPDYPTNDVGDVDHHEECIRGYDIVLEELAGTNKCDGSS